VFMSYFWIKLKLTVLLFPAKFVGAYFLFRVSSSFDILQFWKKASLHDHNESARIKEKQLSSSVLVYLQHHACSSTPTIIYTARFAGHSALSLQGLSLLPHTTIATSRKPLWSRVMGPSLLPYRYCGL
jgi:hypothetical protein